MENVAKKAQVIILAGFLLAIGVIAVTLVLNGLIFSQDVASRDDGVPEREVIQFRNSVNETLKEAVTNNGTYGPDVAETEYERFLNAYEERVNEQLSRRQAEVVFEESPSSHDKTVAWAVGQRGVGEYTNTTGGENWVVAEDIGDIHKMEFNISRDGTGDGFRVNATSSSDFAGFCPPICFGSGWAVVVDNGSDTLTVQDYGGFGSGASGTYPLPNQNHVVVNLTEGSIGGTEYFDGTDDSGGLGEPGAVRFEEGNKIEGNYDFRFDDGVTNVGPCTAPCRNPDDNTPPQKYAVGVVHKSKDIAFEYANRRVTYNETLTVTAKQDEINAGFGNGSGSGGSGSVGGGSNFAVTVTGSNSPVEGGNTLEVFADIENTGTKSGTKTVDLSISGETGGETKSLTLSAGSSISVTLDWDTDAVDASTGGEDYTATVTSPDATDSTGVKVCDKTNGGGNKCKGGNNGNPFN